MKCKSIDPLSILLFMRCIVYRATYEEEPSLARNYRFAV